MIPIIQQNIDEIIQLAKQYSIRRLSVFGSALTNDFNDKSDIDFLYSFNMTERPYEDYADAYFDLLFSLKKLLNREIDLVSENDLSNHFFQTELNMTKVLLYESSN